MKYSNYIGVAAALAVIATCFFPWVYINSINATLTGLNTDKTNYGSPGLMNIVMAVVSIFFFLIPRIWAKRANIFVGAFNIAWAFRNYLLITQCHLGECPEKKWGMFCLLIFSLIHLIMCLFPKVDLNQGRNKVVG